MLNAKLVVVGGDAKSSEVRLKLPTVIGRGKEASLTVPHALVSRRHTEIFERDGKLFVRDLGSLNGTFVNNLKIEGEQVLAPNQLLTLGNITFRAVYEVAADSLDSIANSQTVSCAEVTTEEVAPKEVVPKIAMKKSAASIDINETVPVDEFKIVGSAKPAVAKPVADQPVETADPQPPVAEGVPFAKSQSEIDENVELDDAKPSDDDTDKSFKSDTSNISGEKDKESISSIFSFDEEAEQGGQSVAVSALGDLPATTAPAVGFVGNVDFGDDVKPAASQIEPVEIDLGVEKKPAENDDDPGLGSFLNKLPR